MGNKCGSLWSLRKRDEYLRVHEGGRSVPLLPCPFQSPLPQPLPLLFRNCGARTLTSRPHGTRDDSATRGGASRLFLAWRFFASRSDTTISDRKVTTRRRMAVQPWSCSTSP